MYQCCPNNCSQTLLDLQAPCNKSLIRSAHKLKLGFPSPTSKNTSELILIRSGKQDLKVRFFQIKHVRPQTQENHDAV